jgi:hypothetical protein
LFGKTADGEQADKQKGKPFHGVFGGGVARVRTVLILSDFEKDGNTINNNEGSDNQMLLSCYRQVALYSSNDSTLPVKHATIPT